MPRAYCGLISLTLIKRILADHDALFGGVSPDIYSAALISAHSVNALDIDFPAVIPGASGASKAGQSAAGRHVGVLRDNDHIRPFRNLIWQDRQSGVAGKRVSVSVDSGGGRIIKK